MKVTMQITLDGMLRALRWHAHNAAETVTSLRADGMAATGDPERQARDIARREPGRDHVRVGR